MKNKAVIGLAILLVALASCKATKNTMAVKPEKVPTEVLMDSIQKQHIDFQWLSMKARVDYDNGKKSENFTANIRMRKDSVIWVSITALMGVEVARMMITKDSVEVLNKLKKEHTKKPFNLLDNVAPFKVDIGVLQDLLLGNYVLDTTGEKRSKVDKYQHLLEVDNDKLNINYFLNGVTFLLENVDMKEKSTGRQLTVELQDYQNPDGHEFSYERTLQFKADKKKMKLHLKFSRLTWDEPLTFPFYVSDKYDE